MIDLTHPSLVLYTTINGLPLDTLSPHSYITYQYRCGILQLSMDYTTKHLETRVFTNISIKIIRVTALTAFALLTGFNTFSAFGFPDEVTNYT